MKKTDDQFGKKETEDRMRAALKGARISGHKSIKDIAPRKAAEPAPKAKPKG